MHSYYPYIVFAVLSLATLTNVHLHDNLGDRYNNYKLLSSPSYELYWSVDESTGNISLAVRANTTGWVGFGVSPNGGMPNSDVVMGWVKDNGEVAFQVSSLAEYMHIGAYYAQCMGMHGQIMWHSIFELIHT